MPNILRLLLTVLLATGLSSALAENKEVRIGLLSFRPLQQTLQQWQATADYLNETVDGEYHFVIEPMLYPELDAAINQHRFDFVLTNPEHYVTTRADHGLAVISTLMPLVEGHPVTSFGGVIFTRAERDDIATLADIRGKVVAAAAERSFGAYLMQRWTLYQHDIKISEAKEVRFTGLPLDKVVTEVLSGAADVGFVRTGVLENMAHEGKIKLSQIKVLNLQPHEEFPQLLSTEQYPEWAFSATPDVPDQLIKAVSLALLKIHPDDAAAIKGNYYGFTPPGNYAPVEALMLRFQTNPDRTQQFDVTDVVRKYALPLFGGVIAILVGVLILLLYLARVNRRLKLASRERTKLDELLRHANASLEDKVTQRTMQLQESETRFRSILDSSPIAVRITDAEGQHVLFSNHSYAKLIGVNEGQAEGKTPVSYYAHPEKYMAVLQELSSTGKPVVDKLMELSIPNRGTRWVLATYIPFQLGEGKKGILGWLYDITERKLIENELTHERETIREQNDFLNTIFESEPECVKVVAQNGDLLKMNRAGLSMLEVNNIEEARQFGLIEFVMPGYRKPFSSLIQKVFHGDSGQLEFLIRGKNGTLRWLETHAAPLRDATGQVVSLLGVTRDITKTKEHQKQLEHIAHYDALTNLPNRVLLADRLQHAMAHSHRHNKSLAVAYLDLDGFKTVNDKYGHNVGDELLIAIAQRMKSALREGDSLARIGGDEFVAVLVDLEQPQDSEPVLARLLQAAADSMTVGNAILQVSASVGVTFYPQDGADADQLMRHADQAMYVAKQAGKNRYHLFDVDQDVAVKIQRESIEHIHQALERQQFVLYFQPKVNMKTGKVIGAEALIRWQHPERGLLPPDAFLPIIEDHKISVDIGEWVISTALQQMNEWHAAGLEIPVSVNIGGRQLQQPDFVAHLSGLLSKHPDVPSHWLELEILETSALDDIAQISSIMHACREIGVRFALDDFGTGYSSLTYLKHLPAELIKIDQSFVRDMLDDPDDLAIVNGVIGLAASFQRKVIAEGVETVAHGSLLLKLGCETAQGYGIARPMPAAEMPGWISNWRPDSTWTKHSAKP